MKLIVAGTRTFNEYDVLDMIDPALAFFNIDKKLIKEIVSGTADGVDRAGEIYQEHNEESMELQEFKPDWGRFKKKAGHIRNGEMAQYGDALLLFWDGESPGSKNMKKQMLQAGKPVYEIILKANNAQAR